MDQQKRKTVIALLEQLLPITAAGNGRWLPSETMVVLQAIRNGSVSDVDSGKVSFGNYGNMLTDLTQQRTGFVIADSSR